MNLFGGASPQPKPLPSAPAVDPAQIAAQQTKAAQDQLMRQAGGRASNQLTGAGGDTLGSSSVTKQLTGG